VARFLVDESLPRAVTAALRSAGHDTADARDIGLRGQTDLVVQRTAASEVRILVTGDVDFANPLRFPPGSHPGIVVLRVPTDLSPSLRAAQLLDGIARAGDNLPGKLVIVEAARVRIFG